MIKIRDREYYLDWYNEGTKTGYEKTEIRDRIILEILFDLRTIIWEGFRDLTYKEK